MIKDIGARLKEARRIKGFQQNEIAQKLGISRAGYSRIETGRVEVTTKNLVKIAKVLNISLDWLIFGKEEDQIKQGFFSAFGKYAGAVEAMFAEMKEEETTMHAMLSAFFERMERESLEALQALKNQKEKEKNG